MKYRILTLLLLAAAYGASEGANARDAILRDASLASSNARMQIYGETDAPIGHVQFCLDHPSDCRGAGLVSEGPEILTAKRWEELQRINREFNLAIKPVSDQAQYGTIERWTYPTSGKGDCEDYVLLKRKKLIELGWAENNLLITVVRDENDEGHAVLTARTHRGDLILDNKHSRIVAWNASHYTFIKRQSGSDPRRWESLVPLRLVPNVATAGEELRR